MKAILQQLLIFSLIPTVFMSISECKNTSGNSCRKWVYQDQSKVLNKVLEGYDARFMPSKDGSPVHVGVALYIMDMVPTKMSDMEYQMSLFFRQKWRDYRLEYNNTGLPSTPIEFNHEFSSRIWKPDLFFPSVHKKVTGELVTPNLLGRLANDGMVYLSQNLHLTIFCKMELNEFPFDNQLCRFRVESYAYPHKILHLYWMKNVTSVVPPKMKDMLRYTFVEYKWSHKIVNYSWGVYDKVYVDFTFSRNINYYLLQMYLPCILIVILSWVGFWIDYRSTPARVALGVTTVFTMITFNNSIHSNIPSVDYSKLIDWYMLVSFIFVFMSLIEFVVVGMTDRTWKSKRKDGLENFFELETRKTQKENVLDILNENKKISSEGPRQRINSTNKIAQSCKSQDQRKISSTTRPLNQSLRKEEGIHYVDRIARYTYPFLYFVFNIVYFTYAVISRNEKKHISLE